MSPTTRQAGAIPSDVDELPHAPITANPGAAKRTTNEEAGGRSHFSHDLKLRSLSVSRGEHQTQPVGVQPRSKSVPSSRRLAAFTHEANPGPSLLQRRNTTDVEVGTSASREAPRDDIMGKGTTPARSRSASPPREGAGYHSTTAHSSKRPNGSGSSSGSGSTITQVSFTRREVTHHAKPDALSFLDPDSPAVTEESIKRSVAEAANWRAPAPSEPKTSPSARSSSSSSSGSFRSDASDPLAGGGHETDPSTSPEQSVNGDAAAVGDGSPTPKPTPNPTRFVAQVAAKQDRAYRYGTPEMPRGTANHPHLPAGALNPRMPSQHAKHLPRAEKLPLTGYELLASRLSSHPSSFERRSRRGSVSGSSVRSFDDGGPQLRPIYRRFEALNHRLLLHLQDELAELEEQLHRLDTADTQTRRLASRILPASRRAEYLAGGELQWHKTDILGKIGYKLGQYNHVLSSFTETQRLTTPSHNDIETYRTYLATQQPIAEIETRFLDPAEDLVTLAPSPSRSPSPTASAVAYLQTLDDDPAAALTPIPRGGGGGGGGGGIGGGARSPHFLTSPSLSASSSASSFVSRSSRPSRPGTSRRDEPAAAPAPAPILTSLEQPHPTNELLHLAIATAVAVLVPVLTFAVIPGFVGRMTVVLLVALAVFGAQVQAGTVRFGAPGEMLLCASVYGAMMAVVAGMFA